MRRVNPDTLKIEEVERAPKLQYVYVLLDEGNWDYEHITKIDIFKDFQTAFANYKNRVASSKDDMRQWCCEEDIVEDESVHLEREDASFDTYQRDEYDRLSNTISIIKKEVI